MMTAEFKRWWKQAKEHFSFCGPGAEIDMRSAYMAGRNAGLEAAAVKVHELTGNSCDADDIRALKTAEAEGGVG